MPPRNQSRFSLKHAQLDRLLLVVVIALMVAAPLTLPASASFPYSPPGDLATSLIAYWKLDEASGTRVDELSGCGGGGCDLTDNATVTQAVGKVGNAALFTAANSEFLSHADVADLSTGDIDFSFVGWIYPTNLSGTHMAAAQLAGGTVGWQLFTNGTTLQFDVGDGGAGVIGSAVWGSALSTNTWYFVVAWHDAAANQVGISVNNGTPVTAATTGAAGDSTAAFTLGERAVVGSQLFWDGRLDEAGWWKKVLSSTERGWLYNSGNGCTYPFTACEPTPTPTASNTPTTTPTPTDTPTATFTPTVTETPTPGPSPTPSDTPIPGPTNTPSNTPVASDTPAPTLTPTPTPRDYIELLLPSGDRFVLEKRVTYGDIGVVASIWALLIVSAVYFIVAGNRKWL